MKFIKNFFATLIVVLLIGIVFLYYQKSNMTTDQAKDESGQTEEKESGTIADNAKKKIVEKVVDEALDKYVETADEEIKSTIESVTPEDKDKITEIISDNLSLDSVSEVQEFVENKDTEGLMEYAQDKLTAEEYSDLTGIIEKYSNELQGNDE